MVEGKPGAWRWYHHLIWVATVVVIAVLWDHVLKPSDRVAKIVFVICAVGLVVSVVAIQIRKRHHNA